MEVESLQVTSIDNSEGEGLTGTELLVSGSVTELAQGKLENGFDDVNGTTSILDEGVLEDELVVETS